MAVQAIKKKEFGGIKKSIADLKKEEGFSTRDNLNMSMSNADKKMSWLVMPKAFEKALRIPGFPVGYLSIICGHSNTGKSTLVNCIIAAAQKQGYIPVIYDTENNFDFNYAISCGMKAEPVYGDVEIEHVDEETGEISYTTEERIVTYDGDFFYLNSTILAEKYGNMDYSTQKETKTKRKRAVLEDIAQSMTHFLNLQEEGRIDRGLVFIWDSIGSISSFKNYKSIGNNMFDAGAISQAFSPIVNDRIPASRKMSSPYTNTFIAVNKVWLDSMTVMVGPPSLKLKGGNTFFYGCRLIILMGGQLTASTKRLMATSKGVQYNYGIETKAKTLKNHLPKPWTVSGEGVMCCVPNGLVSPDELDDWKKENMLSIIQELKELGQQEVGSISENEIQFEAEEDNSVG